jgi:AmmeMemoRadiSam system protein B
LIHVAVVLGFRDLSINGDQLTTGQDAKDSQSMTTRPSAVAGLFYADDPDELRMQVLGLLADVAASTKVMPKALIAPHAGYAYSGRVAAAAFATLLDSAQMIKRVVLIGPAHYFPVRGIAAPTVDAFETPLGRVAVDLETLSTVADLKFIIRADAPHAPEHALEVELPFLQTLLTSFEVVPLIVGEATPHDVAHVLRRSWGGPETLIVVSSDLSHYHPYAAARQIDRGTVAAILALDSALDHEQACGATPINGLALCARRRHLKPELIDLRNSGDTAGDKSRVVGYAAFAFTEQNRAAAQGVAAERLTEAADAG